MPFENSITKSAISEGTIEITKPEEQKQDISKVNRNTKGDNTNALKDEFDPKKIAERQEMAALFGELGANAIRKIAEANGWKDGSPEKIAMHAALAAVNAEIVKGNITAAAITGGSTEALSNAILKAVGEAKGSSASAQWAAAVIGAALSTATGGDAQSGASIAANAIKNNHRFTLAQGNAVIESTQTINVDGKEVKVVRFYDPYTKSYNIVPYGNVQSLEERAIDIANDFVSSGKVDIKNMKADYVHIEHGAIGAIIDKEGNVYMSLTPSIGKKVGLPSSIGYGFVGKDYKNSAGNNMVEYYDNKISGLSVQVSAIAGVGGTVGVGASGPFVELNTSLSAGISGGVSYVRKIKRIDL